MNTSSKTLTILKDIIVFFLILLVVFYIVRAITPGTIAIGGQGGKSQIGSLLNEKTNDLIKTVNQIETTKIDTEFLKEKINSGAPVDFSSEARIERTGKGNLFR